MTYATKIKTTVVGNVSTGKTSIVLRLLKNEFGKTESTVGASFFTLDVNDIRYEIWDTAGSERYLSLAPMYYRGSKLIIMVFDVNDLSTIERLRIYFDMIDRDTCLVPKVIIVGNKIDLIDEQQLYDIKLHIADKISTMTNITISDYVYTSAKTGHGIREFKNAIFNSNINITPESDNLLWNKPIKLKSDKSSTDCSC